MKLTYRFYLTLIVFYGIMVAVYAVYGLLAAGVYLLLGCIAQVIVNKWFAMQQLDFYYGKEQMDKARAEYAELIRQLEAL